MYEFQADEFQAGKFQAGEFSGEFQAGESSANEFPAESQHKKFNPDWIKGLKIQRKRFFGKIKVISTNPFVCGSLIGYVKSILIPCILYIV